MFYFLFYRFKFYFMVKLIFKGDRGYFEIILSCKLKTHSPHKIASKNYCLASVKLFYGLFKKRFLVFFRF
ncbi:hypothetical protein HMPREF1400_00611 [Helicobacter pylori GAM119Bi]|nr:hypothetical protein HMPREF1400_00611 [Helicobacter pylori GAM119Bi]